MDVSVVVSTFNRKEHVERLLASLDAIEVRPGNAWELILVDNNSTDGTADVLREFSRDAKFPIRYAFEPRQGKSFGLNTGISLAAGGILAFTDDDAIVSPDWLQQIIDFFKRNPAARCVGGMVKRHDPRDVAAAVRLSPEPAVLGLSNFKWNDIQVIGCNMAMRADLFRTIGAFDTDLGPGSRTGGGDDIDILYRILCAGYDIHYVPDIRLSHNHGRRTAEQIVDVYDAYASGIGAFYCKYLLRRDRTVARWAYRECCSLMGVLLGSGCRRGRRPLLARVLGAWRYIRHRRGTPADVVRSKKHFSHGITRKHTEVK